MKIALTGHTKGIGNAIKQLLENEHEIVGFSRTNGYNINEPDAIYVSVKLVVCVIIKKFLDQS